MIDAVFTDQYAAKSQFANIYFINGNIFRARSSKSTTNTSFIKGEVYALCAIIPKIQDLSAIVKALTKKLRDV